MVFEIKVSVAMMGMEAKMFEGEDNDSYDQKHGHSIADLCPSCN